MARKTKFRSGDIVRVAGERGKAKIRAILKLVNGALLETEIGGFRTWNLDDLTLVERANPRLKSRKMSDETRIKLQQFWSRKKAQLRRGKPLP
jgi:hypothetical protein